MVKEYKINISCIILLCLAFVVLVAPGMAATTQVQIVKYANDGTTVLASQTVNYSWMAANLPVWGDGTTHYYAQGPVFVDNTNETLEQELRWRMCCQKTQMSIPRTWAPSRERISGTSAIWWRDVSRRAGEDSFIRRI